MNTLKHTKTYEKWINSLADRKGRAVILTRISRLKDGHYGDVDSVGGGVFELRIFAKPGYRVYFCKQGESIVLLLAGGDKSTQAADIEKAKRLAAAS